MKEEYAKLFPDTRLENLHESNLRQAQLIMLRTMKIIDYICIRHGIDYWLDGGTLIGAVRHGGFIPWDDDLDISMTRDNYQRFIEVAREELPEGLFLQSNITDPGYDMPWIKIRDNNSLIEEYKVGKYHRGLFVDIFPMDFYGEDHAKSLRQKRIYGYIYKVLILVKEPFERIKNKKLFVKTIIKLALKLLLFPYAIMDKRSIFERLYKLSAKMMKKLVQGDGEYVGYGMDVIFYDFFIKRENIYPLRRIKFEDSEFLVPNNYHEYLTKYFGDYMKLPPVEKRVQHNLGIIPVVKSTTEELTCNYNNWGDLHEQKYF
jgi:lipopolysaccharide cholinephosphotransferase